MSTARDELREALCRYTTDTFSYMKKVKQLYVEIPTWMSRMEKDLISIKNIKDEVTAVNKKEELQKELADMLRRLEVHGCVLEAVEKLAVTSLNVFKEEKHQVSGLPQGIKPEHVRNIIQAARLICPLLLEFKKDPDVLLNQLDKYIQTIQKICEKFQERGVQNLFRRMSMDIWVELRGDLSGEEIQRMLCQIKRLDNIRMDPDIRMVFLFEEECCFSFINEFSERKDQMLQSLKDLEKIAYQLESAIQGAKISSVAGSSVGVLGGALSIASLTLMPVSAGLSLGLTMVGIGLGVTSGVTSVVTTATEMRVKAVKLYQSFMEDVQSLQDCLKLVVRQIRSKPEVNNEAGTHAAGTGASAEAARKGMEPAGAASLKPYAVGVHPNCNMVVAPPSAATVGAVAAMRSASKLASDIPDVGQARVGLIGLNALFIGLDLHTSYKDSESLAKGSETEASQFIRAQDKLWRPKIGLWEKIYEILNDVWQDLEKNE